MTGTSALKAAARTQIDLPASYGSPSNSQLKVSAEESDERRQSYFCSHFSFFMLTYSCSSFFSYFRLILGQAARENVQLPCDSSCVFKVTSHLSNGASSFPSLFSLSFIRRCAPRRGFPQVHTHEVFQVPTPSS